MNDQQQPLEVAFGSLSKAREQRSERGPTHLGKLTFKAGVRPGDVVYLAAWLRTGEDGTNYYSIKASEPRTAPRSAPTRTPPPSRRPPPIDDLDAERDERDEIPF